MWHEAMRRLPRVTPLEPTIPVRKFASNAELQDAINRSFNNQQARRSSATGMFPGGAGPLQAIEDPVPPIHEFRIRTRGGVRYVKANYAAFAYTHMTFNIETPEGQADRMVLAIAADQVREVSIEDPVDK